MGKGRGYVDFVWLLEAGRKAMKNIKTMGAIKKRKVFMAI